MGITFLTLPLIELLLLASRIGCPFTGHWLMGIHGLVLLLVECVCCELRNKFGIDSCMVILIEYCGVPIGDIISTNSSN